jgi:uncharacterized repeat protein (TIGR02059 family)
VADAAPPNLNVPVFVVQEGGVDTHSESAPADLVAIATVNDADGFVTTNVELYESGVLIGNMTNGGGGVWSRAVSAVPAGNYSYRSLRITAAGSVLSAAWTVTVTGGDVTAPTLSSAVINTAGTLLTLTYNEALNTGSTPGAGDYSLAGTPRTVSSTSVVGSTVLLTLSGAVIQGAVVTVSYTSGVNPVEDVAGNNAANLVAQATTNNSTVDGTAPTLSTLVINAAGTSLTLTYNEALDTGSTPATGAFTLANALLSAITAVNVTGSTVVLTLSPAMGTDETGITLSYTAGGAPIQDVAGNDAANFSTQAVTNSSTHDFVPSDVTGLVGWFSLFDAADFTESAGTLLTLKEKVSGTNNTLGTLPAYSATALGGTKPGIDLNGTTHWIGGTHAAIVAALKDSNACTVMTAWQPDNADRLEAVFGLGAAAVATNRTKVWGKHNIGSGAYTVIYVNDAATAANALSTQVPSTGAQIGEFYNSTSQAWFQKNGAAADYGPAAYVPGTTTPDRWGIGCRPDSVPDTFFDGKISEILIFDSNLSSAIRSRIRVWMGASTRWNIAVTP